MLVLIPIGIVIALLAAKNHEEEKKSKGDLEDLLIEDKESDKE